MEPGHRRILISLLVAAAVLAGLFKYVVGPIAEEPQREEQQRSAQQEVSHAAERTAAIDVAQDRTALARAKWRKDVTDAQAHGDSSATPPLIAVRRNDGGDFVFTNISGQPICFSVARVSLPARCVLGPVGVCQTMAPGEEVEFDTRARRNDPPCRSKTLEYRIGRPVTSDLPWWSDSALEDFDRVSALLAAEFARAQKGAGVGATDAMSTSQLQAENADDAAFLGDTTAAQRWLDVLVPLQQIQLDVMAAKQAGTAGQELAVE
jgi:hypothetical protein